MHEVEVLTDRNASLSVDACVVDTVESDWSRMYSCARNASPASSSTTRISTMPSRPESRAFTPGEYPSCRAQFDDGSERGIAQRVAGSRSQNRRSAHVVRNPSAVARLPVICT